MMIKLFFTQRLADVKALCELLKENIRFFFAVSPALASFSFIVLFYYAAWKALSLIPWSSKLDTLSYSISNALWHCVATIIWFIFNNLGFISIMVGLTLLSVISNFFHKRKMKKRLPIVGIPNKDNVTVLLALFKLRCLEIGKLYSIIRSLQKEADEGNWVELFLIDSLNNYNIWSRNLSETEKTEPQQQRNKEMASVLLQSKFNFCKWDRSNDSSLRELIIAFKLEHEIYDVKPLQGISIYGELHNTIFALIESYNKFNSRPAVLFIYNQTLFSGSKSKIIESHDTIEKIWDEIIFALKSSLIFLKMQNDTNFNIEEILKEIDALRSLQSKNAVQAIMKLKNLSDDESWFTPAKNDENLILNQIKQNPLNDLY